MDRTYTISTPSSETLRLVQQETTKISLDPSISTFEFVVSDKASTDPIVAIPGTLGFVTIFPETIGILEEGGDYFYEIWDTRDSKPLRLVNGPLKVLNSIGITGYEVATQFLANTQEIVFMSQAAYEDPAFTPVEGVAYFTYD